MRRSWHRPGQSIFMPSPDSAGDAGQRGTRSISPVGALGSISPLRQRTVCSRMLDTFFTRMLVWITLFWEGDQTSPKP